MQNREKLRVLHEKLHSDLIFIILMLIYQFLLFLLLRFFREHLLHFGGGQLLHDKTSCIFNKLEVFKVIFVENVILDDSASGQNTFLIIVWKFKEILRK